MSEFHSDLTEVAVVSTQEDVDQNGTKMSKFLNDLTMNTYVSIWINIGGRPYRCLRFRPLFRGNMAVDVLGMRNLTIPWDSEFTIRLGNNYMEFTKCFREFSLKKPQTDQLTVL